jgi:hypothetical protein
VDFVVNAVSWACLVHQGITTKAAGGGSSRGLGPADFFVVGVCRGRKAGVASKLAPTNQIMTQAVDAEIAPPHVGRKARPTRVDAQLMNIASLAWKRAWASFVHASAGPALAMVLPMGRVSPFLPL